jgi:serine-type D-Ala-D-Ala carboxypeptidase
MLPPLIPIPPTAFEQRQQFATAYAILERSVRDQVFPGAAFAVLADDKVLALDGIGSYTYDPESAPVSASSVFDLASVTKVLATTSMAMLLQQRGLFELDRPVVEILPGFAAGESSGSPRHLVTLRMLLAHASGLPGYERLFEVCAGADELFAACLRLPLKAAPGTVAEYSDPGFIVLGRALEVIAGEAIQSFSEREVFTPLKMTSTVFRPPAAWRQSIPPTEKDTWFRHRIIQGEVQDENCYVLGGVSGHAGLFSNAADPIAFARCILMPDLLFATKTIELFTTRAGMPSNSSRALGWDTPSQPSSSGHFFSARSAGHLGYAGTSLWIDLERRVAIALLTNRTWPDRQSQSIRAVRPLFYDAIIEQLDIPLR